MVTIFLTVYCLNILMSPMSKTPEKRSKKLFQTSLNLPLEHLKMIEELDAIGKDAAEIRRRGAMKEIEKEYKRCFQKSS